MDGKVLPCLVACITMVMLFGSCSCQAQRGCIGPSTALACENDNLQLQCPFGSTLKIMEANYGRTAPYSLVCHPSPRGINAPHEDLSCGSSSSSSTVSAICNGLQACSVPPSNRRFGDPCGGTYKYLNVSYICVPGLSTALACENDNLQLQCPSGSTLQIVRANYGRTAPYNLVCHPTPRGVRAWNEDLSCASSSSTSAVSANCEGRQSCSVPASNGKFGDPCVGTYKYLSVSYICV